MCRRHVGQNWSLRTRQLISERSPVTVVVAYQIRLFERARRHPKSQRRLASGSSTTS